MTSIATPADQAPPPERRPSAVQDLTEIVQDLVQHWNLLYQLTLRDIRIRYKQAVMGFGWALLVPCLIVLSGFLVRVAMSYVSGSELETTAIASIAVKAIPWGFFIGAIGFATNSLVTNTTLVTKIYFPREVLPLSTVLASAVDSLIGTATLALILPFLGVSLSLAMLWVPVLALLLFLFTTAAGLFLSCANLFFRDVKYIVQVLITFGIFFTPVFFDASMFGPVGAPLAMLNPLAPILEGVRLSVVEGYSLLQPLIETTGSGETILVWTPWYLAYSTAWTVVGLIGSALLFHRSEFVFAEYV